MKHSSQGQSLQTKIESFQIDDIETMILEVLLPYLKGEVQPAGFMTSLKIYYSVSKQDSDQAKDDRQIKYSSLKAAIDFFGWYRVLNSMVSYLSRLSVNNEQTTLKKYYVFLYLIYIKKYEHAFVFKENISDQVSYSADLERLLELQPLDAVIDEFVQSNNTNSSNFSLASSKGQQNQSTYNQSQMTFQNQKQISQGGFVQNTLSRSGQKLGFSPQMRQQQFYPEQEDIRRNQPIGMIGSKGFMANEQRNQFSQGNLHGVSPTDPRKTKGYQAIQEAFIIEDDDSSSLKSPVQTHNSYVRPSNLRSDMRMILNVLDPMDAPIELLEEIYYNFFVFTDQMTTILTQSQSDESIDNGYLELAILSQADVFTKFMEFKRYSTLAQIPYTCGNEARTFPKNFCSYNNSTPQLMDTFGKKVQAALTDNLDTLQFFFNRCHASPTFVDAGAFIQYLSLCCGQQNEVTFEMIKNGSFEILPGMLYCTQASNKSFPVFPVTIDSYNIENNVSKESIYEKNVRAIIQRSNSFPLQKNYMVQLRFKSLSEQARPGQSLSSSKRQQQADRSKRQIFFLVQMRSANHISCYSPYCDKEVDISQEIKNEIKKMFGISSNNSDGSKFVSAQNVEFMQVSQLKGINPNQSQDEQSHQMTIQKLVCSFNDLSARRDQINFVKAAQDTLNIQKIANYWLYIASQTDQSFLTAFKLFKKKIEDAIREKKEGSNPLLRSLKNVHLRYCLTRNSDDINDCKYSFAARIVRIAMMRSDKNLSDQGLESHQYYKDQFQDLVYIYNQTFNLRTKQEQSVLDNQGYNRRSSNNSLQKNQNQNEIINQIMQMNSANATGDRESIFNSRKSSVGPNNNQDLNVSNYNEGEFGIDDQLPGNSIERLPNATAEEEQKIQDELSKHDIFINQMSKKCTRLIGQINTAQLSNDIQTIEQLYQSFENVKKDIHTCQANYLHNTIMTQQCKKALKASIKNIISQTRQQFEPHQDILLKKRSHSHVQNYYEEEVDDGKSTNESKQGLEPPRKKQQTLNYKPPNYILSALQSMGDHNRN